MDKFWLRPIHFGQNKPVLAQFDLKLTEIFSHSHFGWFWSVMSASPNYFGKFNSLADFGRFWQFGVKTSFPLTGWCVYILFDSFPLNYLLYFLLIKKGFFCIYAV